MLPGRNREPSPPGNTLAGVARSSFVVREAASHLFSDYNVFVSYVILWNLTPCPLALECRSFPFDSRCGRDDHGQRRSLKTCTDLKVGLVHAFPRRLRDPDADFLAFELPEDRLPDDPPPVLLRPTALLVVPERVDPRLLPRFVGLRERVLLLVLRLPPDSGWAAPAAWPVSPTC
jgi:hypothetical protein